MAVTVTEPAQKKNGFFRDYNDIVFEKFWQHELDIDEIDEIAKIIESLGSSADLFREYAQGIGRDEHALVREQAEERGVFGVPMFVLNNELFWGGDRIPLLAERLQELGLSKTF